jgi:hypothetical protein
MVGAGTGFRTVLKRFLPVLKIKRGMSFHRNNVPAYIQICIEAMLGVA